MIPPTPLPEEWIEKFDERFGLGEPMPDDVSKAPIPQWSTYKQQDIKIFIRSLLHQSYEQGKREMGEKTIKWMTKQGYEGLQKEYKNSLTKERKEEE